MLADAPDIWQWEATAAQRVLIERDASGARLLKESGPLARLRITARPTWAPAGRLEFNASLAHARLDYDGRTQAGAPLSTRSRHDEVEAGVRWSPAAAFDWGTPAVTFDGLWFRRAIAATARASGLEEKSVLWLPGVAWTTPAWPLAGAQVALQAQWRTSVHHHLAVDYDGLFDPSSLRGGRRAELSLAATAAMPSGWSLSLQWRRTRQAESPAAAIFRGGIASGTVHQPRTAIDDVGLTLSKNF